MSQQKTKPYRAEFKERALKLAMQSDQPKAQTAPLSDPESFQYDIDMAQVAKVWRRGSVNASWMLNLAAEALHADLHLGGFTGWVSDSGEGRWIVLAAVESCALAPVLVAELFSRHTSRGETDFADKELSNVRYGLGGHREKQG